FTAPRSDPVALDAFRAQYRRWLQDRTADPDVAFQDTLTAVLWNHHPRTRSVRAEDLDAIDLQQSLDFFRERISDADDFTFALVGRIDLEAIRPLVLRYIGGLPSLPRKDHWRDTGRKSPPGVVENTFRKGVADKATTAMVFTGPFEWGDRESHSLDALVEALRIRLRKVIREDKSGTYGVSVFSASTREPHSRYRLQIGFNCDPARLDELTQQTFAVIRTMQASGTEADEVTQIREVERRQFEVDV